MSQGKMGGTYPHSLSYLPLVPVPVSWRQSPMSEQWLAALEPRQKNGNILVVVGGEGKTRDSDACWWGRAGRVMAAVDKWALFLPGGMGSLGICWDGEKGCYVSFVPLPTAKWQAILQVNGGGRGSFTRALLKVMRREKIGPASIIFGKKMIQ